MSFPAAAADQTLSGLDDPETVGGAADSGTPTTTGEVADSPLAHSDDPAVATASAPAPAVVDSGADNPTDLDADPDLPSSGAADSADADAVGVDPSDSVTAVIDAAVIDAAVIDAAVIDAAVIEVSAIEQMPAEPASLPNNVIDIARAAAVEEAGTSGLVGDYLGAVHEDAVAVTASFAATDRGYCGWYWSVTLALVEPEHQTISEVVLLPGDEALLAPSWVPWEQRIRHGDVGAGDLLPTAPDDPRLVPGYLDSDDPAVKEVEYEFGFGRVRVLGREGRDDAAERWHDGPFGPESAIARQAQANCVTCAFYLPLAGLMGMALGACANEFSPADGRVVDAAFGCGAHSQTVIDAPMISASTATVVDELTLEVHRRPTSHSVVEVAAGQALDEQVPEDVVVEEQVPEDVVVEEQVPEDVVVEEDAAVEEQVPVDAPGEQEHDQPDSVTDQSESSH